MARLFERRVVFLSGNLDESLASRVAAELMTLDGTGDEPVNLQIDCGGGTLEAAFVVMDVIDLLGVPVHATCAGRAEGPPVGVLAVASRRIAAPHARFRLTEPQSSFHGTASELTTWVGYHQRQLDRFYDRLSAATGRPARDIAADSRDGRYLDAEEARRAGLVDEIADREAEVYRWPPRGFGFRPNSAR
jgi:ATP-dependent Clp protease protease subunit